jgi:pseudaminic acid synthase
MNLSKKININKREIGPGRPVYIVAEMSANHNQDLDQAKRIVEAAKSVGADAVKLQTYTPDSLTIDCDNDLFKIKGTVWKGRKLYDLYKEASTPWHWHPELQELAHSLGLDLFSTPFDETAVDFLMELNIPVLKVASFELVHLPLLQKIARTGKPVIMSTGMATLAEIEEAVQTLKTSGCREVAILKCTSAYPASPEEMNLRTIPHLADTFNVPVGLSDHTVGITAPAAAVTLGASIIEKHLTLSRDIPGPDSAFSLTPDEFKAMAASVRETEKMLGRVSYEMTDKQKSSMVFRRSLFVAADMASGDIFSKDNVRAIRPGHGLHTRHLEAILGKIAAHPIKKGTPFSWDLVK